MELSGDSELLSVTTPEPSQHTVCLSTVPTLLHGILKSLPVPLRLFHSCKRLTRLSRERRHVFKVLRDSNYHLSFIWSCKSYHNSLRQDSSTNDSSSTNASSASPFVVLLYVRGVSERISRVLRNNGVKVGYKPFRVLRTCFPAKTKGQTLFLAVQRCCLQGRLR